MRIEVDWDLCESNGVCMGIIPEVFQLGDDDMLTVLQPKSRRRTKRKCAKRSVNAPGRRSRSWNSDQLPAEGISNPEMMTALQSAAACRSFAAFW